MFRLPDHPKGPNIQVIDEGACYKHAKSTKWPGFEMKGCSDREDAASRLGS
jgi:hypothetical protein